MSNQQQLAAICNMLSPQRVLEGAHLSHFQGAILQKDLHRCVGPDWA